MGLLDDQTIADLLHETHALTATFRAGSVSVRCEAAQVDRYRESSRRGDETEARCYLLVSEVATAPQRGEDIIISAPASQGAATEWAGTWTCRAAAEPTGRGEWRCTVLRQVDTRTQAGQSGGERTS